MHLESGNEYLITGVKKHGNNRHWAGSGKVQVDIKVLNDFLQHTEQQELDINRFEICTDIIETDPNKFYEIENHKK